MLRAFLNAARVPELRRKMLFTLAMIVAYRVGAWVPVPGVAVDILRAATAGRRGRGRVKRGRPVKVAGHGDIREALTVGVEAVSATARTKIEAAGGSVR